MKRQEHSFFLFGPRATGKSTWLKEHYSQSKWFDLLLTQDFLRLSKEPSLFRNEVIASQEIEWVVVDEVQKIPALLNEIQWIITNYPKKYKFALCGSSARKLKRLDVNLLAGRVFNRYMYPLTLAELGYDYPVEQLLSFGSLPKVCLDPQYAIDTLEAYTLNYLQQEIRQEALAKDLATFSRFLEVAALMNGEVVNISGVSRDSGVARTTVHRYFEILVDTLVGKWLYPWRLKLKVKETAKPKFYFFDCGVARACAGLVRERPERSERGHLLKTLVFHELSAWNSYLNAGGDVKYWATNAASKEIDFIWHRGKTAVGIEVKASDKWRREWGKGLKELYEKKLLKKCFIIY
ncbi:MAG: ATP-binding protein, partial [Candidatus Dadabacteria bacterium]